MDILKTKIAPIGAILNAESEGFEPPETVRPQWFSRPPHSTTLPALLVYINKILIVA